MDSETAKYWKTPLTTVSQILEAFENIPDNVELPTDIFLEPPEFCVETDEDSGDEDDSNPNHFTKKQLQAGIEIRLPENILNEACVETNEDVGDENVPDPLIEIVLDDNEGEKIIAVQSVPKQNVKIRQNWIQGDEEDLKLSAMMYRIETWDGNRIYPATLSNESHAIDFFQLYFPVSFIELVVKETMNYASKKRNKSINIEADDVYAFFGVMILSGYNELPRRRLYWANDDDTINLLVSKWMRRNLFEDIFTNIHFCDVDFITDKTDRFAKIRPLISHLNQIFLKYAPVEMNVSVDESMIPYYGRHPCKQFIRNKPVRFGYKAWVAATRLGYCYQFDIYQGRHQQRDKHL